MSAWLDTPVAAALTAWNRHETGTAARALLSLVGWVVMAYAVAYGWTKGRHAAGGRR